MDEEVKLQKILLKYLSKAIFDYSFTVPEKIEWDKIFTEARNQSVLPLAFFAAEPALPKDTDQKWSQSVHQILANNIRSEYEHMELHKLMTLNDIPYVVLKGTASASFYPDPALRTMGDVDFLVKRSDFQKASNVLRQAGFSLGNDDDKAHVTCMRAGSASSLSVWEMHREPVGIPDSLPGDIIRKYLSDIIETAETVSLKDGEYRIPDIFHHGLILLLHTAAHLTSEGIGLRHLCDWAVFEANLSDEEFKKYFEAPLSEIGLWDFARILTLCSVRYLHCPERTWTGTTDNSLLELLMNDILGAGNFGRKDADRPAQIKYIANRGEGTVDGKSPLLQLAQTIDRKAKSRYSFVSRYPVLLLAGWIMTGISYMGMLLKGKRRPDTIKTLKAAEKRKEIYRQLRLFEPETE